MRIFPLGEEALVVEVGDRIDASTHQQVRQVFYALEAARLPGVRDLVPAYATVTVFYDPPGLLAAGAQRRELFGFLEGKVRQALEAAGEDPRVPQPRQVEIPVCYESDFAPDVREVARQTGQTVEEVVRLHASADYFVHLIGFSPGFPYLGGLPSQLQVPRRREPRTRVPAGSVAIAGAQAGIYPLSTPGGWNLIGRTPLRLFRPDAHPPALLAPGDHVRFVVISADRFRALEGVAG